MDSLEVITNSLDEIVAVLTLSMSFIMGLIVMPVTVVLKKFTMFDSIEPKEIEYFIVIVIVAVMAQLHGVDSSLIELMNAGFAIVGGASLSHYATNKTKKVLKK